MTVQHPRVIDERVRVFAIFAAGILLNLGLSFLLSLFTPLVVGFVCGFVLRNTRFGIVTGFLSAAFSYSLIFVVTGYATDLIAFGSAVLIMSVIGGAGGYIGNAIQNRIGQSLS